MSAGGTDPGRTIPLEPVPIKAPPPPKLPAAKKEAKDGTREVIETVVFVVVLVLLLKTFLAEAFVIPTGSMATTLLGYHRNVTCEMCGYRFRVNASSEADPQERVPALVIEATCPNCRYHNDLRPEQPRGVIP